MMAGRKKVKSLKGFKAFNKVFDNAIKYKSSKLLMAFTFDNENSDTLLLGVSSPKKKSKKAVWRNRIKRLLRESIRQINAESDSLIYFKNIILIWYIPLEKSSLLRLDEVKSEVNGLLNRAICKYNEIHSDSHNKTL